MNLPHSVAELQAENVTLELEGIDRMYLNCYVPQLTTANAVAAYFRNYKGHRFASTKQAVETSEAFRRNVFDFAKLGDIPIHRFAIIPFDEDRNLPSLIADYQERKQLAIDLILKARPFP